MNSESQEETKRFIRKMVDTKTVKPIVEELINEHKFEHMSLVATINLAIFTVTAALYFNYDVQGVDSIKILLFTTSVMSLIVTFTNVWFIYRLKVRLGRLKKEQKTVYQELENNIEQTIQLVVHIISSQMHETGQVLKKLDTNNNVVNLELKKINSEEKVGNIIEDASFMFGVSNQLALYKTLYNNEKCMDNKMEEPYPTLGLYLDRISSQLKHFGLALNGLLVLLTLILTVLLGGF